MDRSLRSLCICFVLGCLFLFSSLAYADERVNPIEGTIDTGSAYPLLTNEIPGMVIVLTYQQLQARGYRSLFEVLRDLPGFSTRGGFGQGWVNVTMDGEQSQNNEKFMLFIDGVLEQDLWRRSIWLSYQYSMYFIKNITVFYGPAATRFGANAVSGVIFIDTKKAEDLAEGYGDVSLTKDIRNNMWALDLMLGHSYNKRSNKNLAKNLFSWYARGRFYFSDARDQNYDQRWLTDNIDVRNYLDQRASVYRQDYQRAFPSSDQSKIDQEVASYRKRLDTAFRDDPANSGLYANPVYSDRNQTFVGEAGLRFDNWFLRFFLWSMNAGEGLRYPSYLQQSETTWSVRNLAISLHHLKSELWSSGVGEKAQVIYLNLNLVYRRHEIPNNANRVFFEGQQRVFVNPEKPCTDPTGNNQIPCTWTEYSWRPRYYYVVSQSFQAQPKLDFQLLNSRLRMSVGVDTALEHIQGAYVVSDRPDPDRFAAAVPTSTGAGNHFEHIRFSAFLQGDVTFTPWLSASVGLRSEWDWVRGDLDVVPNCYRPLSPCYRFSSPLVGRASLIGKFGENIQARLSYGYAFLSPSNWQLYGSNVSRALDARDLLPQDKHSVELNVYAGLFSKLYFTASIFHHWLNNVDALIVVPFRQNEVRNINIGNQMTLGGRLYTVLKLFPWMDISVALSVLFPRLDVQGLRNGSENPIWLQDVPLLQGSLIFDFRTHAYDLSHFFGSIRINAQTGRQNTGFDQAENGEITVQRGPQIDPYFVIHLSAGYLWRPPDSWPIKKISVSASAENILNWNYNDIGFRSAREPNFNPIVPMPGINGFFNLSVGF
ncbi:MAG: TonB-dependent receptor [Myxococcales bacterium]|nr:TonB-dependent receptor [Myxococcales bacterium]